MGLGEEDLGVKYCSSTYTPHDFTTAMLTLTSWLRHM